MLRNLFIIYNLNSPVTQNSIRSGHVNKKERGTAVPCLLGVLEEPHYFAGVHIDINPSKGRVRAGSRQQADGSCHRAEKSCTAKDQHIPNRKDPTFGHSLLCWIEC